MADTPSGIVEDKVGHDSQHGQANMPPLTTVASVDNTKSDKGGSKSARKNP